MDDNEDNGGMSEDDYDDYQQSGYGDMTDDNQQDVLPYNPPQASAQSNDDILPYTPHPEVAQAPMAAPSRGFFNNANPLAHLGGTLATVGQRLGNVVRGLGQPAGAEFIPQNKLNARGQSYQQFTRPDINDYYGMLGATPDIGDKALQFGIESTPFFKGAQAVSQASKIPFLTENMLAGLGHGGFFGDKQGQNNLQQAGMEGVIEAPIAWGGMKGLSMLGKPVGSYVSSRLVDPLLERASQKIGYEGLPGWDRVQSALRGNFTNAAERVTPEWEQQTAANTAADLSGNAFKPDNVVKTAQDALTGLSKKTLNNPNLAKSYEPSVANLQNMIENPPQTYQAAVDRIHDLNAAMKLQKQATGMSDLFLNKTVGNLKKQITQDFKVGSGDMNPNPYEALQTANAATKAEKSYSDLPQMTGESRLNKVVNEFLHGKNPADEGMMNSYMPAARATGVNRWEKFAKDVGDKDLARAAMQKYALRDVYKNGEPDLKGLLSRYDKFSPEQRKWLFTPEQKSWLDTAAKQNVTMKNREKPGWLGPALTHKLTGLPGVAVDFLGGQRFANQFASPQGAVTANKLMKEGFFHPKGYVPNALLNSYVQQGAEQ